MNEFTQLFLKIKDVILKHKRFGASPTLDPEAISENAYVFLKWFSHFSIFI